MGVAHSVQALDDLVLGVHHVEVHVGLQAAHVHEDHRVGERVGVERTFLYGEQTVGALAEVLVVAGGRQLVIALDGWR